MVFYFVSAFFSTVLHSLSNEFLSCISIILILIKTHFYCSVFQYSSGFISVIYDFLKLFL